MVLTEEATGNSSELTGYIDNTSDSNTQVDTVIQTEQCPHCLTNISEYGHTCGGRETTCEDLVARASQLAGSNNQKPTAPGSRDQKVKGQ